MAVLNIYNLYSRFINAIRQEYYFWYEKPSLTRLFENMGEKKRSPAKILLVKENLLPHLKP